MKIGLTFDLKDLYLQEGLSYEEAAEFDSETTISAIETSLNNLGYETERIGHVKNLIDALSKGKRWDLVFNFCEGLYGYGREAVVPAILDAYKIPYTFSDPLTLSVSLHKGITKMIVRDLNITTSNFFVVEDNTDLQKVNSENLEYPLFVKPISEGTSKGISTLSKIKNKEELHAAISGLQKRFNQPILVEEFLPGREFTVGILGSGKKAKSIGVMEIIVKEQSQLVNEQQENIYSFALKAEQNYSEVIDLKMVTGDLEVKAKEIALKIWAALGGRDAGRVDLKIDKKGNIAFIELNPLAGLTPDFSDLVLLAKLNGIDYQTLIGKIVESAKERI